MGLTPACEELEASYETTSLPARLDIGDEFAAGENNSFFMESPWSCPFASSDSVSVRKTPCGNFSTAASADAGSISKGESVTAT